MIGSSSPPPLRRSSRKTRDSSLPEFATPLKRKQTLDETKTKSSAKGELVDHTHSRPSKKTKSKSTLIKQANGRAKSHGVRTSFPQAANSVKEEVKESNAETKNYWLLKAEPESRIEKGKDVKFSIDDLQACTKPEPWSGVRNHVAKNNMLRMRQGDLAFFYHSSCKIPGVVGIMEIVQEATPDQSAFDASDPYYDPKSDSSKPRWFNVHVEFRKKFDEPENTTLSVIRKQAEIGPLSNMALVKQSRLSVSRVSPQEWNFILDLAGCNDFKDASSIQEIPS